MGDLIDDEVLHTFAVFGGPKEVAAQLIARYGHLVDRIQLSIGGDDAQVAELMDALRAQAVSQPAPAPG
jgi:hypothetical protein